MILATTRHTGVAEEIRILYKSIIILMVKFEDSLTYTNKAMFYWRQPWRYYSRVHASERGRSHDNPGLWCQTMSEREQYWIRYKSVLNTVDEGMCTLNDRKYEINFYLWYLQYVWVYLLVQHKCRSDSRANYINSCSY